jgi:predicted transcriptional regulator
MTILPAILRGEFNISGFRNKNIKLLLKMNAAKVSRLIRRLRVHGLIKKAVSSCKYYLTGLGKETIVMALKIKEMVIIPAFNF